jgi:hypothetical protein
MKPKSVTLTFKRWFSEADFGELTVPGFQFVASPSRDLPLTEKCHPRRQGLV